MALGFLYLNTIHNHKKDMYCMYVCMYVYVVNVQCMDD